MEGRRQFRPPRIGGKANSFKPMNESISEKRSNAVKENVQHVAGSLRQPHQSKSSKVCDFEEMINRLTEESQPVEKKDQQKLPYGFEALVAGLGQVQLPESLIQINDKNKTFGLNKSIPQQSRDENVSKQRKQLSTNQQETVVIDQYDDDDGGWKSSDDEQEQKKLANSKQQDVQEVQDNADSDSNWGKSNDETQDVMPGQNENQMVNNLVGKDVSLKPRGPINVKKKGSGKLDKNLVDMEQLPSVKRRIGDTKKSIMDQASFLMVDLQTKKKEKEVVGAGFSQSRKSTKVDDEDTVASKVADKHGAQRQQAKKGSVDMWSQNSIRFQEGNDVKPFVPKTIRNPDKVHKVLLDNFLSSQKLDDDIVVGGNQVGSYGDENTIRKQDKQISKGEEKVDDYSLDDESEHMGLGQNCQQLIEEDSVWESDIDQDQYDACVGDLQKQTENIGFKCSDVEYENLNDNRSQKSLKKDKIYLPRQILIQQSSRQYQEESLLVKKQLQEESLLVKKQQQEKSSVTKNTDCVEVKKKHKSVSSDQFNPFQRIVVYQSDAQAPNAFMLAGNFDSGSQQIEAKFMPIDVVYFDDKEEAQLAREQVSLRGSQTPRVGGCLMRQKIDLQTFEVPTSNRQDVVRDRNADSNVVRSTIQSNGKDRQVGLQPTEDNWSRGMMKVKNQNGNERKESQVQQQSSYSSGWEGSEDDDRQRTSTADGINGQIIGQDVLKVKTCSSEAQKFVDNTQNIQKGQQIEQEEGWSDSDGDIIDSTNVVKEINDQKNDKMQNGDIEMGRNGDKQGVRQQSFGMSVKEKSGGSKVKTRQLSESWKQEAIHQMEQQLEELQVEMYGYQQKLIDFLVEMKQWMDRLQQMADNIKGNLLELKRGY